MQFIPSIFRNLFGGAQGAAAGDDGDLLQGIGVGQQVSGQGVSAFVDADFFLFLVTQEIIPLHIQ
jgi:hypothetical protein